MDGWRTKVIERDKNFKGYWNYDLSMDDYHGDKRFVHSSGLIRLLDSPAKFKHEVIDGNSKESSEALRFGQVFHKAILEGPDFLSRYKIQPDFGDFRSKKNCERRDEWLASQGREAIIVTQKEFDTIRGMLDSVIDNTDAFNLLKDGVAEASGFYADRKTGIKVAIRPDLISNKLDSMVDVKTARDCSVRYMKYATRDFKYHVSQACYAEGIFAISGRVMNFYNLIAIEKEPPYECNVLTFGKLTMFSGHLLYRTALDKLNECLETNTWKRRQNGIRELELDLYDLEEEVISGGYAREF